MTLPLLLPLRLETRFYPPGGSPTELRVRVVPDELWFDDHDAGATAPERERLEIWRAAREELTRASEAVPVDEERRQAAAARQEGAWRRLVDVAGVGRARWLVTENPPAAGGAAGRTRRAVGFPRRLEVWLLPDRAAPESAPRLVLEPDVEALRLELPRTDPGAADGAQWWSSYAEAEARGLAGRIALSESDRAALPFEALIVVGLGETRADALFGGHRDAGRLAALGPGLATNTIVGGPTLSRRADPTTAPAPDVGVGGGPASDGAIDPGLRRWTRLLLGGAARLGPTPVLGDARVLDQVQSAVVSGLWSALWGHALNHLWLTGEAVHAIGSWAEHALRPEGPLPAVRIADLPYGVLPVAGLDYFAADDAWAEPRAVAEHLVPRLRRAREIWRAAAEADGTTVGADIEKLLDLGGRVPVGGELRWRKLVPHDLALLLEPVEGRGRTAHEHADWWDGFTEELATFSILPRRRLTAVWGARRLELPLLLPAETRPPAVSAALRALAAALDTGGTWTPATFASAVDLAALMGGDASVLLTLARVSMQLALADDGRVRAGDAAPTLDEVLQATPSRLARWIEQARPTGGAPQTETMLRGRAGLARLAPLVESHPAAVERVLRGAIDAASHRLDAWLTAPATFRLGRLLDAADGEQAAGRLGAYGWVDDLAPGGGGPTAGGAILAPSHAAAATAAILRDRHVRAVEEGDVSWAMDITSRRAREAKRLADAVRAGLHPAVALGLEVERLVEDTVRVAWLRQRFPARRDDDGHRVADGLQVVAAARTEANLWDDPGGEPITRRIRAALGDLLDSYADLLTAQAVHRIVEGRGAIAGQVTDGAAGLGPPPSLEVLDAPAPARALATVVLAALPHATPPADASPMDRADASAARLVDTRFAAHPWRWSVRVTGPGLTSTHEITLAELGLRPSDAATHSAGSLEALAVNEAVTRTAAERGLPPGGMTGVLERADGTSAREEMGRCLRAIGTRPFTLADLTPGAATSRPSPAALRHAEETAHALVARLVALAAAARPLVGALGAAPGPALDEAVRQTRRWGLSSAPGQPPEPARLAAMLARRVDTVEARLRELAGGHEALAAPLEVWDPDSLPAGPRATLARLPVEELGALIAALVAPEGDAAVLSPLDVSEGLLAGLTVPGDPAPLLDWLATVAAVRPRLAALEADLLGQELAGAADDTSLATTHPDDPWQLAAAVATGANGERVTSPPPMVVTRGQQGARLGAGGAVAVALVDRFAEAVPDDRRPPAVAFGFDAPGARAPQALLALVPPRPAPAWTPSGAELVERVLEARTLARVRMALPTRPEIAALAGFLPTAAVPLSGPVGVAFPTAEE